MLDFLRFFYVTGNSAGISVIKKWKLYSASTIKYQYCYKNNDLQRRIIYFCDRSISPHNIYICKPHSPHLPEQTPDPVPARWK